MQNGDSKMRNKRLREPGFDYRVQSQGRTQELMDGYFYFPFPSPFLSSPAPPFFLSLPSPTPFLPFPSFPLPLEVGPRPP